MVLVGNTTPNVRKSPHVREAISVVAHAKSRCLLSDFEWSGEMWWGNEHREMFTNEMDKVLATMRIQRMVTYSIFFHISIVTVLRCYLIVWEDCT